MKIKRNLSSFVKSGIKLCAGRYFSAKWPVFMVFELTYRCNLHCLYCNRHNKEESGEIDTQTVCRIIREAKELGLLRAYFTGGEIFLRSDLAEIIEFCNRLGVMTEIWSNGIAVPGYIDILKQADCLVLSLDGQENVHDSIRERGSFSAAIKAAKLAKEAGIYVSFNFTLCSKNTGSFPEALDIVRSLNATIGFQPVTRLADSKKDIKELIPEKGEFEKALGQVEALKKKYPLAIENSFAHLSYLRSWPQLRPWPCLHGRTIFTVLPNSGLIACTNGSESAAVVSLKGRTLKEAISRLPRFLCSGCVCYGAYDASGPGNILPVSWEVFNFHVLNKWKR